MWKRFRANCSQCHGFTSRLEKRPIIQNGNPTTKEGNVGLWILKRETKMGLTNSAGQGGANVEGNGGLAWG
jgi:mono/diheme cytochrome c family protein